MDSTNARTPKMLMYRWLANRPLTHVANRWNTSREPDDEVAEIEPDGEAHHLEGAEGTPTPRLVSTNKMANGTKIGHNTWANMEKM